MKPSKHHTLFLVLLAVTSYADNPVSKPASSKEAPLAEPNEIQRWTKSMEALNGLTKANWRDFLQSFTDHTIKTGASFDEHRTLALTRIGEVAGKEALDVWKKEEEPTGKFDKCWRGMVGFAAKDPVGAQKWWGALADGELKKQLVGAMTWGLSQAGEPEVTKFFLAAPD